MLNKILLQPDIYQPFLRQLENIFSEMDDSYQAATDYYGFSCDGCQDNCCLTRFSHYTLLEYLYVRQGYAELNQKIQIQVRQKSKEVIYQTALLLAEKKVVRLMCPLNDKGLCRLYMLRPMICRLHGIPHEFQNPALNKKKYGPGCRTFTDKCAHKKYFIFDRTRFYLSISVLEKKIRKAFNFNQKLKMTIAEMLYVPDQQT